ncbi:MAG: sensor histidine kinase [Bryobacteraceae bacterium]
MPTILAYRRRMGTYFSAWAPVAAALVIVFSRSSDIPWPAAMGLFIPLVFYLAAGTLSMGHLTAKYPLHGTPPPQVLAISLASGIAFSLTWILAAKLIALAYEVVDLFPGLSPQVDAHLPVLFGIGLLLWLLVAAVHYALTGQNELAESKRREVEAMVQAREAELRALRAQVNPHFLFNTLHSISALTGSDPARAREMCVLLAEFLRHTLRMGEKEMIALSEEAELARNYLAVERVRFGKRLRVEEEFEAGCEECAVPPLLLQPLVENAVKHGISSLIDGGVIRVEARRSPRYLRLVVENPFDAEAPPRARHGLGLANVRARLAARYGEEARLEAGPRGGVYRAEVMLPC